MLAKAGCIKTLMQGSNLILDPIPCTTPLTGAAIALGDSGKASRQSLQGKASKGTLGFPITGVAYEASLADYKVLSGCFSDGSTGSYLIAGSAALAGLDEAVADSADVILLPWSLSSNQRVLAAENPWLDGLLDGVGDGVVVDLALRNAAAQGGAPVAAAGDAGGSGLYGIQSPGLSSSALAVAAVDNIVVGSADTVHKLALSFQVLLVITTAYG